MSIGSLNRTISSLPNSEIRFARNILHDEGQTNDSLITHKSPPSHFWQTLSRIMSPGQSPQLQAMQATCIGQVSTKDLPRVDSATFTDSSFFSRNGSDATLPCPADVRERCLLQDPTSKDRNFSFPPVRYEDLGLIVKFGKFPEVTVAEGQCLWALRRALPAVPVPEVYGWTHDDSQTFIYMELVSGETLEEQWGQLNPTSRVDICKQLSALVTELRRLRHAPGEFFLGQSPENSSTFVLTLEQATLTGSLLGILYSPTKIGRQQVPSARLLNFTTGYPGRINSRFDATGRAKSFQRSQTHIEVDCPTMPRLCSRMPTSIQAISWFRKIRNRPGFLQLLTGGSQDGIQTTGSFARLRTQPKSMVNG